eukprot:Nitzschia sp. Nitz4//scaffold240_size29840//16720//19206//NITZ4_008020-RA/size29840-processed-gene-0.11-mRNA-1//1//CDS//3329543756//7263//frame0
MNGLESGYGQDEVLSVQSQNIPRSATVAGWRSNHNALQDLGDHDSFFCDSQCDDCESDMNRSALSKYSENQEFLYEQDASTMSYGSVYEYKRPRGKMTLLTNLALDVDTDHESREHEDDDIVIPNPPRSPPTPDGARSLKRILKEFENEMDASISDMKEENDNRLNIVALSSWQEEIRKGVSMENDSEVLSVNQAKHIQQVLHQACREVETLKENNEQFLSEIEQTEEEHVSEMKLYDEQTKKKLAEMKAMYQEELEALIQEKDAAIAEAGRQAARYVESGRKQIESLKKQINTLKANAVDAVKESSDEVADKERHRNDEDMKARLDALRKSYESQLEQTREEAERRTRTAVNEAVTKATQTMLADRDREVNAAVRALRTQLESQNLSAIQTANDTAKLKISTQNLTREHEATTKALRSILSKVETRYAKELSILAKRKKESASPVECLQVGSDNEFETEVLLKKVIEAFAFLLEHSESRAQAAEEEVKSERTKNLNFKVHQQARIDLIANHRNELDFSRKQVEVSNDKIERLEQALKVATKEKRALLEKLRKEKGSHRADTRRLNSQFDNMEDPALEVTECNCSALKGSAPDSSIAVRVCDSREHSSVNPSADHREGLQTDLEEHTVKYPMHKVRSYPSFPLSAAKKSIVVLKESRDVTLENRMLHEGLERAQTPVSAKQNSPNTRAITTRTAICNQQAVATNSSPMHRENEYVRSHTAVSDPTLPLPPLPQHSTVYGEGTAVTSNRIYELPISSTIDPTQSNVEAPSEDVQSSNNCSLERTCPKIDDRPKRRSFAILRSFRSSKAKASEQITRSYPLKEKSRRGIQ